MYFVIRCYSCGQYLLAQSSRKTRICPYCGFKIVMRRAYVVAQARSAEQATAIIKSIKESSRLKRRKS